MVDTQTENLDQYPVAAPGSLHGAIPTIDIAALQSGVIDGDTGTAIDAMARACEEWGFFQVVNHGVDQSLIDAVWTQTEAFFNQPAPRKRQMLRTRENPWGYYDNELTKNQRDRKQVFDFTTDGPDPIYRVENQWPDEAEQPEFRKTLCRYRDSVTELSRSLLSAFAVGLDLPANTFQQAFSEGHTGFIRLNYYPVDDPLKGTDATDLPEADLGVHHHTDAGALTVLLQGQVSGLQVFRDGYWYDVAPAPGAFVINTGDMMQVWSNDRYRAAMHRVLAMEKQDRYSIPFFFNPSANTRISPLSSVVDDRNPARYREIHWSEFRYQRTDGDYADYGTEVQISQYRI